MIKNCWKNQTTVCRARNLIEKKIKFEKNTNEPLIAVFSTSTFKKREKHQKIIFSFV